MADAVPPFALPELGRSLRALGSVRDACEERAHAAVFGPLLEARAQAASAGSQAELIKALNGRALVARIDRLVVEAARAGTKDEPSARARIAHARELLEPLVAALGAVDREAEVVNPSIRMEEYSSFVSRVADVFSAADVACGRLSALLASGATTAARSGKPGWRGGRPA